MGVMAVIIIVAEQSIAQSQIIVDVLPQEPDHSVVTYPLSVFEDIKTSKQLFRAQSKLVNLHGPKGSGKTEFVRQYAVHFLDEGPHFYFKLNKLSNRRNCQVFTVDARNFQALNHSLTALNNKLKQPKGTEGATESHKLLEGIQNGLKKQSRWLLIFENVPSDLNITDLLSSYQEWGDGQIIVTSDKPIQSCKNIPISSVIPRSTAEKVFFSIAPFDEGFDPTLLHKRFGQDLRSVVIAAHCVKKEQDSGINFTFSSLCDLLADSACPSSDVVRLYCSLTALSEPRLLLALDFMAKLPPEVPVPYRYIKHHMDTNMYDSFLDVLPGYSEMRNEMFPKLVKSEPPPVVKEPVKLEDMSFYERRVFKLRDTLGLDPDSERSIREELSDIIWPKFPEPEPEPKLKILKSCPLLKFDPQYGGHLEVFNIDDDIHEIIRKVHTEFTIPMFEAALVFQQDERYHRTWMAKFWSFRQAEQTLKFRTDILGKGKVHVDPKDVAKEDLYPVIPKIYSSALPYLAKPISHANIREYEELHHKQVLKSVMAFVDVTIPNTVKGTMESIILHGHLSALADEVPVMFSGLAESCSLHLQSELGGADLEKDFITAMDKARKLDFKGPSHASSLHRYAIWLHNNSRDEEAKTLLEEASRFADSLALNRTIAQVCCELGDHKAAAEHLEKAVQSVRPGDQDILGSILIDLGQVMLLQGKTAMGIKYLQGAIEGFKNSVGTENPEYVRALNVVSIGHLMLGDALRSNRARNEASSVLAKLKKKRLIA